LFYNTKKTKSKDKLYEVEVKPNESKLTILTNLANINTNNLNSNTNNGNSNNGSNNDNKTKYSSDFKNLLNLSTKHKLSVDNKLFSANYFSIPIQEEKIIETNENLTSYNKITTEKIKEKVSKLRIMLNHEDETKFINDDNVKELMAQEIITSKHKRSLSSINKKLETYISNPSFKIKVSEIVSLGLQKSLSNLNISKDSKENNQNSNSYKQNIKYNENQREKQNLQNHRKTGSTSNYPVPTNNNTNYKDSYRYNNNVNINVDQSQSSRNDIIEKTKKLLESNSSIMNTYKLNNNNSLNNNLNNDYGNKLSSNSNPTTNSLKNKSGRSKTYIDYLNNSTKIFHHNNHNNHNNINNNANLNTRDKLNLYSHTNINENNQFDNNNQYNINQYDNQHESSQVNYKENYKGYNMKYDSYKINKEFQPKLYSSRDGLDNTYDRKDSYSNNMNNNIAREYHKSSFSMLRKLNVPIPNLTPNYDNTKTNYDYSKNYIRDYNSNNSKY